MVRGRDAGGAEATWREMQSQGQREAGGNWTEDVTSRVSESDRLEDHLVSPPMGSRLQIRVLRSKRLQMTEQIAATMSIRYSSVMEN